MMRVPKINPHRADLPSLMNEIKSGSIRIPGFQRDFVWEPKRVQTLLDSMCKEYPIGTIFLWKAPPEYNHMLREIEIFGQPPIEKNQQYNILLDGQQRLTSLFVTINGLTVGNENYAQIALDLENNDPQKSLFVKRQNLDNQRYVSVRDLLAYSTMKITQLLSQEQLIRFEQYRTILATYPFSIVTVSDMDIESAIEIFERINRQGRRLERFDLVAASIFTKDFDLRRATQHDIQNKIRDNFGEIGNDIVPQMLALNIKNNASSSIQLGLAVDDVQKNWQQTVTCCLTAIELLRHHFGVAREEFLPYDAILPVLSYFFFKTGHNTISATHLRAMEQWFWRATFSERYSGTSQTQMTEDAAWIRQLIEQGTPFDIQLTVDRTAIIESRMTHTASAARNGVLCLLKLQRPLHLENGTEIQVNRSDFAKLSAANRYQIFPDSMMNSKQSAQSLANFWFVPPELSERLGIATLPPSKYMKTLREKFTNEDDFERIMSSHLIPIGEDSGIWSDNYELFLQQRAGLILAKIYYLARVSQGIAEDDPVVNAVELALRDEIHKGLNNAYGANYWDVRIPATNRESIDKEIKKYINATPGVTPEQYTDPRERLNFANPRDYWEIVKANLACFPKQFADHGERYFRDFQDYRNTTKHNREANTLLSARGLAAFIWFSKVLNLDLSRYGIF